MAQGLRLQLTMKGKVKVKVAQSCLTICDPMDCVDHDKLWKILKELGLPDHLTCLFRNLYVDIYKMWGEGEGVG